MTMSKIKIGIIGGSGLDDPKLLGKYFQKEVNTPYGKPAGKLTVGEIAGLPVVILARHGKKHSYTPTNVPYLANVHALKQAGCTHILATTACGSLREEIKPGDLIFPDQFIDLTRRRELTFYKDKVVHTQKAEPFDKILRQKLIDAAEKLKLPFHPQGTVITIEGPRFSTKAESHLFREWGADVINMSTVPEVVLANEIGIPYQSIAMSTDYDCWKENEEPVSFEMILKRMSENAEKVKKLIVETIRDF
jgi:5'-methylthioadenosine phosphorylase